MEKINDTEIVSYQQLNVTNNCSQTSCDVTQRCKLKMQQGDNGNSEANAQDYLSETHYNYQQNSSLAVGKWPFNLGYSSATPDNHQQNLSLAVVNQTFILVYFSATPNNHQQNLSSAGVNQPFRFICNTR